MKTADDVFDNPLRQFLFFIWAFLLPHAILSFGFKFKIALAWEKASLNATAHWAAEPQLCLTPFLHCSWSSPEEMLQGCYGIYTVNPNLNSVNGWYKFSPYLTHRYCWLTKHLSAILLNTTNAVSLLISHLIFLLAPENPLLGVSAAFLTIAFTMIKPFS